MIEAVILVVFPFCMIWAAITDSLSMTIANRVSFTLIAIFLLVALTTGMGWSDIGLHAAVFAGVLAATFAMFAFGTMGGGDAKLIAATALWMGWGDPLVYYLLAASLLGGVVTVGVLLFRHNEIVRFFAGRVLGPNTQMPAYLEENDSGVPYGLALGMAGLMAFPQSPIARLVIESLAIS
ncbi:prepilin peptidase [Notoacmeibacter sp. MSK16QG-6]|uniref:A24 family peptidase n=1 Tax=Notoacmeibacter sp. MSK16QG-6 TaxID=2957982 RepID=UPI00209F18F8|nr:prepilin peptidase [Notoacmeibacter sp. MSK16QG-6]MCP1198769.1 prepilin peptidase [Notoacmeibacter sp. MSK16QG-6]